MAESIKVKLLLYLWRQGEYRAISPYMAGFSLYSILWHVILILCHFTFWPHRMACGILVPCHCCSVAQLCPTLCDPMNCSMPGLPVHHQLPELAQTHVHRVGDAIQPSHPLSPPSPPALNHRENPTPAECKYGVLTTGPPGDSLAHFKHSLRIFSSEILAWLSLLCHSSLWQKGSCVNKDSKKIR